jgi:lactoylglutathione lyase
MYSSSTRDFCSYFLSLGSGARLELMKSPGESPRAAHLAASVGSREAVDHLIKKMQESGVQIVSPPRVTGDGYYEAVIADSEGNLLESLPKICIRTICTRRSHPIKSAAHPRTANRISDQGNE